MPELPEVETVRRGLQPVMEGARILAVEARRPDLRFPLPPDFAQRLSGRRIVALGRRAKYLVASLDRGPLLVCHLGMSGSFRIEAAERPTRPGAFHVERSRSPQHDHVVFHLASPGLGGNWVAGIHNCARSRMGGRGGWRLPTVYEMRSLIDGELETLPEGHPFDIPNDAYWTATELPGVPDSVFVGDLGTPADVLEYQGKAFTARWLCVRGGLAGSSD